jgi:hypothetical protein
VLATRQHDCDTVTMSIHKTSTTEKATVVRVKWNGLVMVVEGANNNEEFWKMSDISFAFALLPVVRRVGQAGRRQEILFSSTHATKTPRGKNLSLGMTYE